VSEIKNDNLLGLQNLELMLLVLRHFYIDPDFNELKNIYTKEEIHNSLCWCIKEHYIEGLELLRKKQAVLIIVKKQANLSKLGDLFLNDFKEHDEYCENRLPKHHVSPIIFQTSAAQINE